MRSYEHFTLDERESLRIKQTEGKSLRQIAQELDRNVSSISRELKRNGNKDGTYNAWRGVSLYLYRRKNSRRQLRIETDEALRHFVIKGLDQYWSPEIIAAKWNEISSQHVSHSTIYAVLKRKALTGYTERNHLRRRGIPLLRSFSLPVALDLTICRPLGPLPELEGGGGGVPARQR